jgi:endonuclease/exonuclease/phosphatase family metal-dependent hydrolase
MHLVTYNIQYGTGKDGKVDLRRIVNEISGVDVIAMQEVDRFWSRSNMTDQVKEITDKLPDYHWVYGPGVDLNASVKNATGRLQNRRRQFGNLVLSKFPILASRNHLLPKMSFHAQLSIQRSMLDCVIAGPRGHVRIASLHLAHAAPPERIEQIDHIRQLQTEAGHDGGVLSGEHENWREDDVFPSWPHASVLLGDFNMSPDEAAYAGLAGPMDPKYGRITQTDGYLDAWILSGGDPDAGHTKFEDTGNRRIDYCFVSPNLADRLLAVRVDEIAQGSDHQPLWVEMDL